MSGPRSVILVGLSGAGKTTVARLAAEILDAPWADLDTLIAERAGKSIPRIFAEEGEARFRELERNEMAAVLEEEPQVIASGAGWGVQPGAIEWARTKALVIHLFVEPGEAARRLTGAGDRPLLLGDLTTLLSAQSAERLPYYLKADFMIASGGTPEVVATGVAVAARGYGGWAAPR